MTFSVQAGTPVHDWLQTLRGNASMQIRDMLAKGMRLETVQQERRELSEDLAEMRDTMGRWRTKAFMIDHAHGHHHLGSGDGSLVEDCPSCGAR